MEGPLGMGIAALSAPDGSRLNENIKATPLCSARSVHGMQARLPQRVTGTADITQRKKEGRTEWGDRQACLGTRPAAGLKPQQAAELAARQHRQRQCGFGLGGDYGRERRAPERVEPQEPAGLKSQPDFLPPERAAGLRGSWP